jgi:hypothetical protein
MGWNSLKPKTSSLLFGHPVRRGISLFNLFSLGWMDYIIHKLSGNIKHIKFQLHMIPWWIYVQNGLYIHFSLYILGSSYNYHMAKIAYGLEGKVPNKRLVLSKESWIFTFFSIFVFFHGSIWHYIQRDHSNFEVKSLILFYFYFTSSMVLESWVKILVNSNSLILTNPRMGFEPCMLNLISKWRAKNPKRLGRLPNFHEFCSEKVHHIKDPKKENFDVWML